MEKSEKEPTTLVRMYNSCLWSTACLLQAKKGDKIALFSVPLGQPGLGWNRPLEPDDTNMTEGYRASDFHTVHRISWALQGPEDFFRTSQLHWDFLQTAIPIGPLTANCSASSNNWHTGFVQYPLPVQLPAQTNFSVRLTCGSDVTGWCDPWIRVHLFSTIRRDIEVG